jgi:hypothetical protein
MTNDLLTRELITARRVYVALKYDTGKRGPRGVKDEVSDAPLPAEPTEHDDEFGAFWPLYVDAAGRPIHPVRAARMIDDGDAELASVADAVRHLDALGRVASTGVSVNPFDARDAAVFDREPSKVTHSFDYADPIGAQGRVERRRNLAALRKAMNVESEDPAWVPPLMTVKAVAEVFGVTEATIMRWAKGHADSDGRSRSFPTPYRYGGSVRFNSVAILNLLSR